MVEEKKVDNKEEAKKRTSKTEVKTEKETKEKSTEKTGEKKNEKKEAVARGKDMWISTKHAMAICKFIKDKKIREAINDLEKVTEKKKVVPMKGEIPHRKGKIMSGRYPVKASKEVIKVLKGLEANARIKEIENPKIIFAKADIASRPYRRFGSRRFKRTNMLIMAGESKK